MTGIDLGGWPDAARPATGRGGWRRRAALALSRAGLAAAALPRPQGPIGLCLTAVVGFSVLFLAFPGLDLAASELFYRAETGFDLSQNPLLRAFRKSADLCLAVLVIGLIVRLGWLAARRGPGAVVQARRSGFLLAALAIGPGLVVNGLLKSHWGRPRPVMVDVFGGEAPYQPVWRISEWCQSNCSFTSGEASSAAWMVAALVLVPAGWRPALAGPVVAYAFLLSLNRLAFGGHFLSDVVLSWSISGLIFAVLFRLMVRAPGLARRPRPSGAATPAAA